MTKVQPQETAERTRYDRAVREYGSYSNYIQRQQLEAVEAVSYEAYKEYSLSVRDPDFPGSDKPGADEETLLETLDAKQQRPPYWMQPAYLAVLPYLFLIGCPDGSEEHKKAKQGICGRTTRLPLFPVVTKEEEEVPKAFWKDYTEHGWPSNQGLAQRFVTPEEDREVMRRLGAAMLTRPGSAVPTKTQSLASLLDEDITEPGWIIEDVLREGNAMMVYGPSGIGKTFFVHTLMLMASHGRGVGVQDLDTGEWILRAGQHQGVRVGLIDGEMMKFDIRERTKIICGALGLTPGKSIHRERSLDLEALRLAQLAKGADPRETDTDVWLLDREPEEAPEDVGQVVTSDTTADLSRIELTFKQDQDAMADFLDLAHSDWKHQVLRYVEERDIKVIVFDNLSTLSASLEDESKSTSWNPLNDLVVALKQKGVSTILVHHAGKGGNGTFRGSTNLITVLDSVVRLSQVDEEEISGDARFRVGMLKKRLAGVPAIEGKVLRLLDGRWVTEVDEEGDLERILRAYKTRRYVNQTEVAEALNMSQSKVSKALGKAYVTGDAEKDDIEKWTQEARMLRANPEAFNAPEVEELEI